MTDSLIIASAHCDIPCGIYEPTVAKLAARTVARMVDQIVELTEHPATASRGALEQSDEESPAERDHHAEAAYIQAIARRIMVKEAHAEACKRELETLWSDFFKPEHIEMIHDLHERIWTAVKLASKCKQEISPDMAADLLKAVDAVAEAFYQVKNVPERFEAYKQITDHLY